MGYTWDDEKNRANLARHGIAFEDAQRIFEGPTVEKVDDRFDYGEVRVYAIGLVNGLEITVVYTDRRSEDRENEDRPKKDRQNEDQENEQRRIISAWRAEPHERRAYWDNVEG